MFDLGSAQPGAADTDRQGGPDIAPDWAFQALPVDDSSRVVRRAACAVPTVGKSEEPRREGRPGPLLPGTSSPSPAAVGKCSSLAGLEIDV
jgi:hypothetical protein